MYVLSLYGTPQAVAERFERLNEAMAVYPAADQTWMTITQVKELT